MWASAARRQNSKSMFVLLEAGKSTTDFIRLMKRVIGCMHGRCHLPRIQQQARNQCDYSCAIHDSIWHQFIKVNRLKMQLSYPRACRSAIRHCEAAGKHCIARHWSLDPFRRLTPATTTGCFHGQHIAGLQRQKVLGPDFLVVQQVAPAHGVARALQTPGCM